MTTYELILAALEEQRVPLWGDGHWADNEDQRVIIDGWVDLAAMAEFIDRHKE
jgi:hypothetical protein